MRELFLKSLACLIFFTIFLTACGSVPNNGVNKTGMCKQLKHDIIFNGSTTFKMQAQEEQADVQNLNRTYQQEGC